MKRFRQVQRVVLSYSFAVAAVVLGSVFFTSTQSPTEVEAQGGAVTIFLTSGTSWTVPFDWNNSNNAIHVIGGGGGGAGVLNSSPDGGGGAGGAYAGIVNLSLTPGSSVTYQIGAGGTGGAPNNVNGTAGGDTFFNRTGGASICTSGSMSVCAKGGQPGLITGVGGEGGSAGISVGTTLQSGGNGAGDLGTNMAGGGGGGAGPGAGGNASATGSGGSGSNGAGGGGGGANGSQGGVGRHWIQTSDGAYAGGGGGGGGGLGSTNRNGGAGGFYGGGGGGGVASGGRGGNGAPGVIVITYTPVGGGGGSGGGDGSSGTCDLSEAGASNNAGYLEGYAWSDNVGWIQFNGVNHGVYVSPADGVTFAGCAWSDNIGWISFSEDDLGNCPSGTCTARLSGTKPGSIQLAGWAKALSANGNGWDGWINLGQTPQNATPPTVGQLWDVRGYAWGSDVMGWISYNCANAGAGGCGNAYKVSLFLTECNDGRDNDSNGFTDTADTANCINRMDTLEGGPLAISAVFRASPTNVLVGGDTTLFWSEVSGATACEIISNTTVGGIPFYISNPGTDGSRVAAFLPEGNSVFSLNCRSASAATTTIATVTVRSGPLPQYREI